MPDGTYFVQVRAIDIAGNVGTPGQVYLQVTNVPPTIEPAPQVTDDEHPQAVAEVQDAQGPVVASYGYDASGSMTSRNEGGQAWTQIFDGENRLTQLTNPTSGQTWSYAYDGGGSRIVETNPGGTKRLLLFGGLWEVSLDAGGAETAIKRYYAVGGTRLAMRDADDTHFILTDHLG